LLEHGADVEAKKAHGKTAIQEAAKGGHKEFVICKITAKIWSEVETPCSV
jgi:hypothetical protein